jgi:BirA family biotin operon repressor/biotin-[acetyl-CoA-carboxylase] ligase
MVGVFMCSNPKGEKAMEEKSKKTTRQQVLEMLLKEKEPISGEGIAASLGLSRNAVWKAIEQLREEGIQIEARPRKGYRLVSCENRLMEPLILEELLPVQDYRLRIYKEINSTNDEAKRLAREGEAENLVLLAESQLQGKGRRGRRFYSQGPEGLYMSLLLRPRIPFQEALKLTTMTAVAVARAIEKNCNVQTDIKWVNDLYIRGKKVCGILTEAGIDFETGDMDYAVVGIGVNVLKREFPEEIRDIVTTLEDETGQSVSRNRLAADILKEIHSLYRELCKAEGGMPSYHAEYVERSIVLGKEVLVHSGGQVYAAKAVGIDEKIGLIVETEEGRKTLDSGEVSIRFPDGIR